MPDPFIFLAFFALGGLAFVLLVGRQRHTGRGDVDAPAPGSPESPMFGTPKAKPQNRRS